MQRTTNTVPEILGIFLLTAFAVAGCASGLDRPEKTASAYEVLEPSDWVGKELPILENIDIAETLKKGTWLVLLYHHDCPDCTTAIAKYEQMARDLAGNEDFLRIALIAIPPYYGQGPVNEDCPCTLGRLDQTKEWFVTTPATALLTDGQVKSAWEEKTPDFDTIFQRMARKCRKNRTTAIYCINKSLGRFAIYERR
jgi:hypothetical protein